MKINCNESRITKPTMYPVLESVLQRAKELGATPQQIESAKNIGRFEGRAGAIQYLNICVPGFGDAERTN